jgi:hypothetical protein
VPNKGFARLFTAKCQLFTAAAVGPHSPVKAILPAGAGSTYDGVYSSGGIPGPIVGHDAVLHDSVVPPRGHPGRADFGDHLRHLQQYEPRADRHVVRRRPGPYGHPDRDWKPARPAPRLELTQSRRRDGGETA